MVGTRIFCMPAIAALLTGCATAAQRQFQAMVSNNRSTTLMTTCCP
jgi:hypothetical protein